METENAVKLAKKARENKSVQQYDRNTSKENRNTANTSRINHNSTSKHTKKSYSTAKK